MTMGPSSEYARTRLELATNMLSDAKFLLGQGRLSSAVDRAYYAMFHAAQAALAAAGVKAPRSHRGLRNQFGEHVVATGLVEREYARDLTKASEVRQEATYEAYAPAPTADEATDLVERADRFLKRVTILIGEAK